MLALHQHAALPHPRLVLVTLGTRPRHILVRVAWMRLKLNDTGRIAKLPHEVPTPPCTTTGVGGLNGMRRGEWLQTRLDSMTMLTLTW